MEPIGEEQSVGSPPHPVLPPPNDEFVAGAAAAAAGGRPTFRGSARRRTSILEFMHHVHAVSHATVREMQLHVVEITLLTFLLSVVGVLAIAGPLSQHNFVFDFYYNDAIKNRVETYGLPAVIKGSNITVVPYLWSSMQNYFMKVPDCRLLSAYE